MMTRGRAHILNVEEPATTVTMVDTYFARFLTCRSATHSFVSRYSFFCFSHIHSFVARAFICQLGRCAGKLARPMVTKVADNRIIYVTDVMPPMFIGSLSSFLRFKVESLMILFSPFSYLLEV